MSAGSCKRALPFALLCSLLPLRIATASPEPFELSPEELFGATIMSVSKTSEKLMDAPAAIYVLNNEDIRRSGVTSIAEALRLVPGVQVARTHGGSWAVSVRGFNSGLANKLLVLMDGREVYDQLFSGVYWDVQDTMLEDIDRIEVIRGPGASLWGANAVNGVINIITKKAEDTQGGLISAIAGNQDRAITNGRYGGALGNNGHYRAYAKYLNRDEQRTLADRNARDGQEAYRAGFRSDWKQGERDSITFQGDMYSNKDSQFRVSPLLVLGKEEINATGWNVLSRWTRELPEDSRFSVQGYVDYVFRDQQLIADQRTSMDIEAQYELSPMGRHKAIVGGRYRLSIDELTPSPFITPTHVERNDQLFSGFVQDKITLDPGKWFLTLGSKFEHNDYSGIEVQPNARLQWHIDENQMAWGAISRAVRSPSQLEHDLRITYIQSFFGLLPNTNFDSEELIAYELGYRRKLTPSVQMDVALFYNDYDKIAAVSVLPGGPFPINVGFVNGTKAETYGGEVVFNWRANEKLNFSTAYSMLDMQLHGPVGAIDAEVAEGQSPEQQFNVRSQWNIRDDVSFDTTLFYIDRLPNYRIKEYWKLDINLGWQVSDALRLNLVGQDLLHNTHREFISPTDPFTPATLINRSVYGKLTWRF